MKRKFAGLVAVLSLALLYPNRPVFAFNLWQDMQQQTQWNLGSAVSAGTAVALRRDDSSGIKAGQFIGSALAQISSYRFLSLWFGGNFIPQADQSLKAVDTAKVGMNLAYLFRGFVNQPPDLIKNLVVGPSLSMSLFSGPRVVIPFFDVNYQFGGHATAP